MRRRGGKAGRRGRAGRGGEGGGENKQTILREKAEIVRSRRRMMMMRTRKKEEEEDDKGRPGSQVSLAKSI